MIHENLVVVIHAKNRGLYASDSGLVSPVKNQPKGNFFWLVKLRENAEEDWVATPTSHTPAHESTATVAPFQAWRNLQCIIAEGPIEVAIKSRGIVA